MNERLELIGKLKKMSQSVESLDELLEIINCMIYLKTFKPDKEMFKICNEFYENLKVKQQVRCN